MNRRVPLRRDVPLSRGTGLARVTPLEPGAPLQRAGELRKVSARRATENRERQAMARRLWPDGQPPCSRPGCTRLADDLHEPLSRARGGSITDPGNARPLCRPCHDEVTFRPESELGWAYECGLLVHSWDANGGAA